MDVRLLGLTAGLLMSSIAAAQIHAATGRAPRPQPAVNKPAHNSMAMTTTPFNCQQYRLPDHQRPCMKPYRDRYADDYTAPHQSVVLDGTDVMGSP